MDTAHALRETSDALLRDLDVLVAIEEEKRTLKPGDPRLVELAERVDALALRVLGSSARQRELTRVAKEQVESGSHPSPDQSIEATQRPLHAILTEWRDAERSAAAAAPGSPERIEATALVDRLRDEYRAAQEAARRTR